MQNIIRIGVSGYGLMGKVHSSCYRLLPTCSPLPYKAELNTLLTTRSNLDAPFQRVLNDIDHTLDGIDLFDCCTPNSIHYQQIHAAMQKGIAVYCEKPLCSSCEDARKLADEAEALSIVNQTALVYRFMPAIAILRAVLNKHRAVSFSMTLIHDHFLKHPKEKEWRGSVQQQGGALGDLGIHALDALRFILGPLNITYAEINSIDADSSGWHTTDPSIETDDDAIIHLSSSTAKGIATVSKIRVNTGPEWTIRIDTDDGVYESDSDHYERVLNIAKDESKWIALDQMTDDAYCMNLKRWLSKLPLGKNIGPHFASIASVCESVCTGSQQEGVPTFKEAYISQQLIDECWKAAAGNANSIE